MNLGEWLLSFFLIFIWVAWIWLVISILIDIFRSDDLSGWGKAGWTLLVVFLTWIGVAAPASLHLCSGVAGADRLPREVNRCRPGWVSG